MKQLQVCLLSFFYVGFIPKAPGTFGSLATIPLLYLISKVEMDLRIYQLLLLCFIITASIMAQNYQKQNKVHDPQWIVIDEVLGMLTAWMFMPYFNLISIGLLFGLFRFFDIIKIWPASYFDKMEHGAGTILDDIVSGVMTGIVLLIGNYFIKFNP